MWGRRRVYSAALAVAASAIFSLGPLQPRLLDDLRNFVFDSFQRLAPRHYDRETPVRVVAIDEESLAAFGQWPWPRTRLAELTDKLAAAGAASIAFDFIFAEPDRLSLEFFVQALPDGPAKRELSRSSANVPPNDHVFAASIAAAPATLGMTLTAAGPSRVSPQKAGVAMAGDDVAGFLPSFAAIATPLDALADAAHGLGVTNWTPDRDQIVRRIPLLGSGPSGVVPSLALEALRVAQGATTYVVRSSNASGQAAFGRHTGVNAIKVGAIEIATGANADIRPRYSYSAPERIVSAAAILQDRAPRDEIDGRIVFVGAEAVGIGDVRATPLEPASAGVEIHAQILESLLAGQLLARPDWASGLEIVVTFASFVGVSLLLLVASPIVSAMTALGTTAILFGLAFLAFDQLGLLFDPAFPSLAIAVAYGVGALTLWRFEQAAKRHVHAAFGKFVAPAVVDRLVERPERLVLGGETRKLTVLFSDLRDFSALSEGLSAQELTNFMNDYLTPMTDAILESEGTVDKYIGDAIMAFWNAPLDVPAHPRKAALAALQMRGALVRFNETRAARAAGAGRVHKPAAMGVGINLGLCSVGNMGSVRRFDYSILGDAVNLASRLEGLCKSFRADIIASGAVRTAVADLAWLELGAAIVAGRSSPTAIFVLVGDEAFARSVEFGDWRRAHDAMLHYYAAGEFSQAATAAASLCARVSPQWRDLYAGLQGRFAALTQARLEADWSPIWVFDGK
ncbi:MAG: adenylate/guanylate cyclase domain-containing protein [Methylocystaceae bacterium]|nr:MAG: adenylate/guanylate cyclase domain-containing protein [Methylocystaceae bacterium]